MENAMAKFVDAPECVVAVQAFLSVCAVNSEPSMWLILLTIHEGGETGAVRTACLRTFSLNMLFHSYTNA